MNTQGIGLGLAIAKGIVTKFKGQIDVTSELTKGSTFTFSFRLQPEERNKTDEESEEEDYYNRDTLFFEWKPDLGGEEIDLEIQTSKSEEEGDLPSDQLQVVDAQLELLRQSS